MARSTKPDEKKKARTHVISPAPTERKKRAREGDPERATDATKASATKTEEDLGADTSKKKVSGKPRPRKTQKTVSESIESIEVTIAPAPDAAPRIIDVERHPGATRLVASPRHGCLWPIGDPRDKDFRFCGEPTIPGSAYCAKHHRASLTTKIYRRRKKSS